MIGVAGCSHDEREMSGERPAAGAEVWRLPDREQRGGLSAGFEELLDLVEHRVVTYTHSHICEAPSGLHALDVWVDSVALTTPSILAVANAVDAARRSPPDPPAPCSIGRGLRAGFVVSASR